MKMRLLMMFGIYLGFCCIPDNDGNALGGGSNVGNAFNVTGFIRYADGITLDKQDLEVLMYRITANGSTNQ